MGTKITHSVFGHTDDGKQVGIYVNEYTGKILYDQKKRMSLSKTYIYLFRVSQKNAPFRNFNPKKGLKIIPHDSMGVKFKKMKTKISRTARPFPI